MTFLEELDHQAGTLKIFITIQHFSRHGESNYKLSEDKRGIQIQIPKNVKLGYVNNTKVAFISYQTSPTLYRNKWSLDLLTSSTKMPIRRRFLIQLRNPLLWSKESIDEDFLVFDSCLDGYNGTIFAYGQTGSGKTYTMSGAGKSFLQNLFLILLRNLAT